MADLLPHLQQREEKEAREMRAILEKQQERLADTARKYVVDAQETLDFNADGVFVAGDGVIGSSINH